MIGASRQRWARPIGRLALDQRGLAVIEFAIVVPVMLMLIMGLGDLTYQTYIQAVLTGAVQKAGRDSSIQNSTTSSIDAAVMQQVWQVMKTAQYTSKRTSYSNYAAIGPEPFVDTAGTGAYVASKDCFTDLNNNGTWDADPGSTGQGGANDVTVYTIAISYNRLFPVLGLLGMQSKVTLNGTTILKNQPWATQVAYAPSQVCPH